MARERDLVQFIILLETDTLENGKIARSMEKGHGLTIKEMNRKADGRMMRGSWPTSTTNKKKTRLQ